MVTKVKFQNPKVDAKLEYREGTHDELIIKEIWEDNQYQLGQLSGVVIDIGAHIGVFSVLCSALGGTVYAFEPVKENFDLLVKNMNHNKSDIAFYNMAVTRDGRDVHLKTHSNKSNTGGFYLSEEGEKAKSISILDVLEDLHNVEILKLDCEGAEKEILDTIPDMWFPMIKSIRMEYHNGLKEANEYVQRFGRLGYKTYQHDQGHVGIIIATR